MEECSECKGAGFWWKQTCELEVGAKFSEPERIICPKCNGSGKIQDENIDNELSHDQIIAVEKFAENLRECFVNYKKNHPDSLSDIMIDYAIQTLDLHLELARIKFYRWGYNMQGLWRDCQIEPKVNMIIAHIIEYESELSNA